MEKDVISDCTRVTPEGDIYGKARYAMQSNPNTRSVYYVTGVTSYVFSDIERRVS